MSLSTLRIESLRCEYLENPEGIDILRPRLGWVLSSSERDTRQAAYRIRAGGCSAVLGEGGSDGWDSGWVETGQSQQVVYAGPPLSSRQRVLWMVEVRDNHGRVAQSQTAQWAMGLLESSGWKARWIAANPRILESDTEAAPSTESSMATPPTFRKAFMSREGLLRATLWATARGLLEVRANGQRVGTERLAPEWTDYRFRLHYRPYDLTPLLRPGENAIGLILGDGWFSGYVGWQETRGRYGLQTSLLAQLELEYADGTREVIASDSTWRCQSGAIRSSDFMMGETCDARREIPGWDRPGLDEADWVPSIVVPAPDARLVAQRSEPVRITEEIAPVSMRIIRPGCALFDFGQNISGWTRLRVRAPAGTALRLRHGERLNSDGTLYTENLRRARSMDTYICRGDPEEEVYEPAFTFHGFQFVELSGPGDAAAQASLTACVVHSDMAQSGFFHCPHEGINRLWLNGLWSQRDNFLSVPTDCPQRDERLGWMGDAQVFLRTAMYNMDVAAFFSKWMLDIVEAQTPDGIFPDTAPRLPETEGNFVGLDGLAGAAGWADAGIILPWTMWRIYGDTRLVEEHWEAMRAWMDYLARTNPDWLRLNELGNNYGDWLCIPSDTTFRTHSPMKNLLATAFWADDAAKMAEMAMALGRDDQARRFRMEYARIRTAFQEAFVLADGRLRVETQTAYLLALAMRLIPDELRPTAARHLVADIEAKGWHLSTGFIGIRFLNPVLCDCGYPEVAYRLLFQEDYPSWLYPVNHGATTIWERWNGWTEADGFFDPQMNSFNHYSLGSVGEWLFSHVGGIAPDPACAGFSHFLLKPFPSRRLGQATVRYQSPYGRIASAWQLQGSHLAWKIEIPANTSARVHVPADAQSPIRESGLPIEEAAAIQSQGREGPFAIFEIPSGSYHLESTFTTES